MELNKYDYEDLEVGKTFGFERVISKRDIKNSLN